MGLARRDGETNILGGVVSRLLGLNNTGALAHRNSLGLSGLVSGLLLGTASLDGPLTVLVEGLGSAEFRDTLGEQSVSGLVAVSNHCCFLRRSRSAQSIRGTKGLKTKQVDFFTPESLGRNFWPVFFT